MNTITGDLDKILDRVFTPEGVIDAFYHYKLSKWDHFSGIDNPTIKIPLGADGIKYEAFEKQIARQSRNISHRIQTDTYIFYPFREVDKKKDLGLRLTPENTRTLGIASIRDALVQSIVYNHVLYEPIESIFRELDRFGPVSFAYRKGHSAPEAARFIHQHAIRGYWHVYDADVSKFFDTIPHGKLLSKLKLAIGEGNPRLYSLIRRFIRSDRAPNATYKYIRRKGKLIGSKIFHFRKPRRHRPKPDCGVPQGGVLSGMLANLYLHDFDLWVIKELAKQYDLKYVRYADDFIIMVREPALLPVIDQEVSQKLASEDFSLKINEGKTSKIDIRNDGLDFVGFHFDKRHIRIRQKNVDKFKRRITDEIFEDIPDAIKNQRSYTTTLNWLVQRINSKIRGLRGPSQCPRCRFHRTAMPRSWITFFQIVTDDNQLRQLDKWLRETLYKYLYIEFGVRIDRKRIRRRSGRRGLRSLVNELHAVRSVGKRPCLCDLKAHDNQIWSFSKELYQGRTFKTLYRKRLFTVPFVDEKGLQISVRNRQYRISRVLVEELWHRLIGGEQLSRTKLQSTGMRNTSHIVALLAELPGIYTTTYPIKISYNENPPADFLLRPGNDH